MRHTTEQMIFRLRYAVAIDLALVITEEFRVGFFDRDSTVDSVR